MDSCGRELRRVVAGVRRGRAFIGTLLIVLLGAASLPAHGSEGKAAAVWGNVLLMDAPPGDAAARSWNGEIVARELDSVALGPLHCVGVRTNGTVAMWGLETKFAPEVYLVPPGLADVVSAACGNFFSAALKRDGSVVTWGYLKNPPNLPIESARAIVAGYGHLLVLKKDGTVQSYGVNDMGQINVPPGLSNVIALAAGGYYSAALKADGRVAVWGQVYGSHKSADSLSNIVQIASSTIGLFALGADGRVTTLSGMDFYSTPPDDLRDVVQLAVGDASAMAIRRDGTVAIWGFMRSKVPPNLHDVTAGAIGNWIAIALRRDGTLVAWNPQDGTTIPIPETAAHGGVDSIQVFGSGSFADLIVALGKQDSIEVVGKPSSRAIHQWQGAEFGPFLRGFALSYQWMKDGQVIPGATNPVYSIAGIEVQQFAGEFGKFTLTVRDLDGREVTTDPATVTVLPSIEPGTLVEWSPSGTTQRQTPVGIQGRVLAAGTGDVSAALLSDGSVAVWSAGTPLLETVPSGSVRANSVAAGSVVGTHDTENVITIRNSLGDVVRVTPAGTSGEVKSIGIFSDQLAVLRTDGTVEHYRANNPVRIVDASQVQAVAVGGHFLVMLKDDGTVGVDGENAPTPPAGLDSVVAVAAGAEHGVALTAEGEVVAWGSNDAGQGDVPVDLGRVLAIAAGNFHTVALQADGTVRSWGKVAVDTSAGSQWVPASAPPGLSGVSEIAAGGNNTLAILGRSEVPHLSVTDTVDGLLGTWASGPQSDTIQGTVGLSVNDWKSVNFPVVKKGIWNQMILPTAEEIRFFRVVRP